MTPVRLHRQICAFIDVLGGAALFRGKDRARARTFFACLEEFERRLNGWSHHFPRKRRSTALVKTFSDNVFVAFPFGSSAEMDDGDVVQTFLFELRHQLYELTLLAGFPVRGAVAAGPLMFTDKFLFGPALVEAVQLEKAAVFPRVLIGESVLRYVKPQSAAEMLVMRDADGHAFLHYLGGSGMPGRQRLLQRHKEFVLRGLQDNTGRVRERQKYEWLAQYHNFVASSTANPDLAVPIERAGAFSLLASAADEPPDKPAAIRLPTARAGRR